MLRLSERKHAQCTGNNNATSDSYRSYVFRHQTHHRSSGTTRFFCWIFWYVNVKMELYIFKITSFRSVVLTSWVAGSIFFRIAIDTDHVALFCDYWNEVLHFPWFLGFQAGGIVWSRLVNENFRIIVFFLLNAMI